MAKKNELATVNEAPPPALLTGGPVLGMEEETSQEDMIIPRVKLLQALSPELKDRDREMPLKVGDIINSITEELIPLKFLPVFKFTNWIRFNPRKKDDRGYDSTKEPGQIIWSSTDPNDPRVIEEGSWTEEGLKPLAIKFVNFFCYFIGSDMPLILSFTSSNKESRKAGKQLITLCSFSRKACFEKVYELSSKIGKNSNNEEYYFLSAKPCGMASEDDFNIALGFHQRFAMKKETIVIHEDIEEQNGEEEIPF